MAVLQRECWWVSKQGGETGSQKLTEVEEEIVGGDCRGGYRNKQGSEKAPTMSQRTIRNCLNFADLYNDNAFDQPGLAGDLVMLLTHGRMRPTL